MLRASKKIIEGDLLYHAVHGVCRVDKIIKQTQSGKGVLSYSLVPNIANAMKIRFIITVAGLKASGFHALVSLQEAKKILKYLQAGNGAAIPSHVAPKTVFTPFAEQNQTWDLAQTLRFLSHDTFAAQDQKKRQMLERSAKGLVGELAFVFKITFKETAARIQKSLGRPSKINPPVLAALARTIED